MATHKSCFVLNDLDVAKRQLVVEGPESLEELAESVFQQYTAKKYSNLVFTPTASEDPEVSLGGKYD